MWRLTIYRQYKGAGDNDYIEVRWYKTQRGARQAGRYWMRKDDHVVEYEVHLYD